MRLVSPGGAAALLCMAVLAACSDQPSAPGGSATLAEGMRMRIHGSATITTFDAHGARSLALPAWSASGTVKGGIAADETATSPLGVLGLSSAMRALAPSRGGAHSASFVDDAGKRHTVLWIFTPDGGPVRTVGHYIDGKLESATEYEWKHTNGGFTLASARRSAFRDGKILSQVTGSAEGAPDMASRRMPSLLLAMMTRATVGALGPTEAHAQEILSGKCRKEWLEYIAATAALALADMNLASKPLDPVAWFLWLAAAAKATNAEMALYRCQLQYEPSGVAGGAESLTDPYVCQFISTMPGCPDDPARTQ